MHNKERLLEIQAKIAELEKEAANLKEQDKINVLQDVKEKIKTYGLTAEECGFTELTSKTKPSNSKTKAEKKPPKYKRGENEFWSGGRGKQPKWVKEVKQNGGNIEDYLIK